MLMVTGELATKVDRCSCAQTNLAFSPNKWFYKFVCTLQDILSNQILE